MAESMPSWKIDALKSVHVMPERLTDVCTTGVRDGAGVGAGDTVGGSVATVGVAVGWSKRSPPVTQKWPANGALRPCMCPPTSSMNSKPTSLSAAPPPTSIS